MMKTKMLLAAASTLAIAACGGAETETDVAEVEQDELRVADNDDGAVETLLSDEQPPLEGDNPFDDTGIDVDDEFAEADAELDEFGNEIEAEAGEFGRDTERLASDLGSDLNDDFDNDFDGDIDSFGDRVDAEASKFGRDTERLATDMGRDMDRRAVDTTRRADVAPTVTDGVSAKTYTARNTDAYIAQDGELITGSEAALLAGSYDVMIGDDRRSLPLTISGEGDMATGTFDGEPIQVAVTGRNFQFDAPVDMDGETTLMTFTGTYMDGEIDNGVVEAQGDGSTMTFSAERTSDYDAIPTTDANVDTDRDMDMDRDMKRRDMNDRSMTAPTVAPLPRATTRTDEPSIGDPGYDYEDDDREVVDSVRSDLDMLEADDVPEVPAEELPYGADGDRDTEMNRPLSTTTTRSTPITPRTNYDTGVTEDDEADRLMREQMEEDDNRPTGIMRRGTSELEEPLDARGDTYLEEDSGFGDEELDTMNREVDGRDQAIDPLTDDDDALDEAMDDDPNFDF